MAAEHIHSQCLKIAEEKRITLVRDGLQIKGVRQKDSKTIFISFSKTEDMLWQDCLIALADIYHLSDTERAP